MTRAQQVRKKRLKERDEEKRKEEEIRLEVERKTDEMYEWVLDLFERPTKYNSADEVQLNDTYYHKIRIGKGLDETVGITERKFDRRVIENLVKRFKDEEEGYFADYEKSSNEYGHDTAIFRIE